jgi:hypothetical protein
LLILVREEASSFKHSIIIHDRVEGRAFRLKPIHSTIEETITWWVNNLQALGKQVREQGIDTTIMIDDPENHEIFFNEIVPLEGVTID